MLSRSTRSLDSIHSALLASQSLNARDAEGSPFNVLRELGLNSLTACCGSWVYVASEPISRNSKDMPPDR